MSDSILCSVEKFRRRKGGREGGQEGRAKGRRGKAMFSGGGMTYKGEKVAARDSARRLTPFLFMDPAQVVVIFAALRDQPIN